MEGKFPPSAVIACVTLIYTYKWRGRVRSHGTWISFLCIFWLRVRITAAIIAQIQHTCSELIGRQSGVIGSNPLTPILNAPQIRNTAHRRSIQTAPTSGDPDALDIDKLPDAVVRQFPSVAGSFDAAEWQSSRSSLLGA